jgi:hypothetical protein
MKIWVGKLEKRTRGRYVETREKLITKRNLDSRRRMEMEISLRMWLLKIEQHCGQIKLFKTK